MAYRSEPLLDAAASSRVPDSTHAAICTGWTATIDGTPTARAPRFIDINGNRFLWRDLVRLRREELAAAAAPEKSALFELREDARPAATRTAAGRYLEPSLFTLLER